LGSFVIIDLIYAFLAHLTFAHYFNHKVFFVDIIFGLFKLY